MLEWGQRHASSKFVLDERRDRLVATILPDVL